jgi:hypothetical protein
MDRMHRIAGCKNQKRTTATFTNIDTQDVQDKRLSKAKAKNSNVH